MSVRPSVDPARSREGAQQTPMRFAVVPAEGPSRPCNQCVRYIEGTFARRPSGEHVIHPLLGRQETRSARDVASKPPGEIEPAVRIRFPLFSWPR